MIDEKKLIEDLRKCYCGQWEMENSELLIRFKGVCEIINNQPKIGEWIPCSEKIPEENQLVWVSVQYQGGDRESVEGIFKNGTLCRMNGIGLGLIAQAWMPRYVPEPYIG